MRLRRRDPAPRERQLVVAGAGADALEAQRAAGEAYCAALAGLETPVFALGGMWCRLVLLGRACHRAALTAADGHAWGLQAGSDSELRARPWKELAAELDVSAPRGGECEKEWQALDRSLSRLRAVLDSDREPSLAVHAAAYQAVAEACEHVVALLADRNDPQRVDQCWFCGASRSEVGQLFTGGWAAICDACVAICHEHLHV